VGEGGGGVGVGGGRGRAGVGEGGAVPACLICGKLVAVFHLCSRTYTQANMSYLSLSWIRVTYVRTTYKAGKKVRFSQRGLNSKRDPRSSPSASLSLFPQERHYCTKTLSDVAKMGKLRQRKFKFKQSSRYGITTFKHWT
jgi:hypothetical protein